MLIRPIVSVAGDCPKLLLVFSFHAIVIGSCTLLSMMLVAILHTRVVGNTVYFSFML